MALFDSFSSPFEKDTPVLRLTNGKDPNSKWVLWPVFAWRVVAPIPKKQKLNMFQRAVLGFSRAGLVHATEIANRLLIAPELAALVMQELQNMALVDYAGLPTKRGLQMLDDIVVDPPDEAHVGHVLSDPFTGKLWPRFLLGDLPVSDVELNDGGWPILLSGSAGDPWRDRTLCVLPSNRDSVIMARPNASEVLRAAHRHRRQRYVDEIDGGHDVPKLESVSFIDDHPHPYQLALRVCRHESGDWMVDDPFGHGESVELRARLEARLDSQKGLRNWLSPLIGSDTTTPSLGQLQVEATWKVEERLTIAIRQHEMVHERLVAMQRALLEVSEYDNAPIDKWDDVLVKAQKAAERVLHMVQRAYIDKELRLYNHLAEKDKLFNQRYFNGIAADLGFQTPLPEGLSAIRRGKIQYAEGQMKGGLQPILLVALLWAEQDCNHPLRFSAQFQPNLLNRIHELALARDRFAAHDGPAILPKSVPQHVETVFILAESLLLNNQIC